MIIKRFYDEVYRINVTYGTNCTLLDFLIKHKKNFNIDIMNMLNELIEKNPGGFHSTFSNELGQIYFIWVEDKDDVPTLVHEIYHMINSIFEDREVHHGLQNQETFAYYLSYWTKKFINSSKKKKKK